MKKLDHTVMAGMASALQLQAWTDPSSGILYSERETSLCVLRISRWKGHAMAFSLAVWFGPGRDLDLVRQRLRLDDKVAAAYCELSGRPWSEESFDLVADSVTVQGTFRDPLDRPRLGQLVQVLVTAIGLRAAPLFMGCWACGQEDAHFFFSAGIVARFCSTCREGGFTPAAPKPSAVPSRHLGWARLARRLLDWERPLLLLGPLALGITAYFFWYQLWTMRYVRKITKGVGLLSLFLLRSYVQWGRSAWHAVPTSSVPDGLKLPARASGLILTPDARPLHLVYRPGGRLSVVLGAALLYVQPLAALEAEMVRQAMAFDSDRRAQEVADAAYWDYVVDVAEPGLRKHALQAIRAWLGQPPAQPDTPLQAEFHEQYLACLPAATGAADLLRVVIPATARALGVPMQSLPSALEEAVNAMGERENSTVVAAARQQRVAQQRLRAMRNHLAAALQTCSDPEAQQSLVNALATLEGDATQPIVKSPGALPIPS